ncbi:hypothetical protein C3941_15290 [Kaistia algarum]|uniref:glycoside hydrolase family 99-like domain-containing protein n=1 Tax=Kaistia algarum TaxID=2083279 RepID=UPI000CE917C6|nr:glycoside hydrolase family 99-like domain-containing protein [Kaistia algarum]MCX5514437.1 glycoside hydrolase family 99-like domain-containing protein [Kaistia algarum]PPE79173.1 hypothetical protein C3941_15290 [Kaistia algarum]
MRQLWNFERWPGLALIELKLDIEVLRFAVRQRWVSRRMSARFRRSLGWRKDLYQLRQDPSLSDDMGSIKPGLLGWSPPDDTPVEATARSIADEVRRYASPSADFEELQGDIVGNRRRLAKIIAFYLPQFHSFPENDRWWGPGFTEWTNVARAVPRFHGHYQPRIPRDLGFYDLRDDYTMRRQIEMAKRGGLHGFCFYYYNFDGARLLERPLERFLADPSLDMPFCLMWANENWTRRWDGAEAEVLMKQSYDEENIDALVDDLARHMLDPRYIRINGRPLVIIYRPNVIPKAREMVASWREIFEARYGLSPLIFMVQAFGSDDPNEYGFDGAIEFPPHKLQHRTVAVNSEMTIYDTSMTGQIFRYRDFVAASLSFKRSPYPLIRTIFPSWDNDARRQGHGMSTTGSTPSLYRFWLDKMIHYASRYRVFGESMVFINAWNEWAEGTYLEPDLHFGGAYLNETARAVVGLRPPHLKRKVLLVGHDANPHGAQELLLNIGEMLKLEFGCEIEFLLCGDGPMLERYEALAPTRIVKRTSISKVFAELSERGYNEAIVNSLASGWVVEPLRNHFFKVITLVHELPELIRAYKLDSVARAVAKSANEIVFPSSLVLDGFRSIVGEAEFESAVRPQGLYKRLESSPLDRGDVRRELGIGLDTKIVINVGYGDKRKGIDIFADVARRFAADAPEVHFVWAGLTEQPTVEALGPLVDLPNLHWLGHRSDVGRLLAAADVFVLTSREDPFPSVVLEAMASGLPVVAFAGAGGFVDLFDSPDAGALVPLANGEAMADAIRTELARPAEERQFAAERRKSKIARNFSFRDYVFWLLQRLDPELLRVSVVVPNYNYRRYLDQRLSSIFAQTYPLYEVIVLDDASTDGSIEEVEQVTAAAGRGVRVVANEKNSGNVFRQWRKGVELASGDLVWIAEADDASEPQFVATLARKFEGSQVDLAFTDSSSIDADGKRLSSSYQYYYSTVERESLAHSFAVDGTEFAERFMSERNLILNASSAVWRMSSLERALAVEEPDVTDFTVAGDWLLYLRVCSMGGQVGYDSRPLNIHRRAQGVTARTRGETQLREIERLYQIYDRMLPVSDAVRSKRAAYLAQLRQQFAEAG